MSHQRARNSRSRRSIGCAGSTPAARTSSSGSSWACSCGCRSRAGATSTRSITRPRATSIGVTPPTFDKRDIHVHVPEGATPKDGPSAGVAMTTAIVSVLTGIAIRRDVAMTGEVTLRGRVLPIGGLKEKLLAALRAGIKTVLIPSENEKDLAEIPDNVLKGLKIIPVSNVEEVLKNALVRMPKPIDWEEPAEEPRRSGKESDDHEGVVAH